MKQTNTFAALPPEDQKLIISLCEKHPYHVVVDLLAEPRPTGLNITTSISTLCRFYTHYQEQNAAAALTTQFGLSMSLHRQGSPGVVLGGILAMVEVRLLDALKQGKALATLTSEFRLLKTIHATFLADQRERREHKEQSTADYQRYVTGLALAPEADFIRNDLPEDPGAEGLNPANFEDFTREDDDIEAAAAQLRREQKLRAQQFQALAALTPPPASIPSEIPPTAPAKSPEISDISSNFTPSITPATPAKSPAAQPPKTAPSTPAFALPAASALDLLTAPSPAGHLPASQLSKIASRNAA